jgi:hypothetical protein
MLEEDEEVGDFGGCCRRDGGLGQNWVYMLENPRMNLSAVRDS